jgi:hypothetical protein
MGRRVLIERVVLSYIKKSIPHSPPEKKNTKLLRTAKEADGRASNRQRRRRVGGRPTLSGPLVSGGGSISISSLSLSRTHTHSSVSLSRSAHNHPPPRLLHRHLARTAHAYSSSWLSEPSAKCRATRSPSCRPRGPPPNTTASTISTRTGVSCVDRRRPETLNLRQRRATQQIEALSDQGMILIQGFLIDWKGVRVGVDFVMVFTFCWDFIACCFVYNFIASAFGIEFFAKGGGGGICLFKLWNHLRQWWQLLFNKFQFVFSNYEFAAEILDTEFPLLEFAFKRTENCKLGLGAKKLACISIASIRQPQRVLLPDWILIRSIWSAPISKYRRARGRIPPAIIGLRYHWKQIIHVSISRIVISRYLEGIITRISSGVTRLVIRETSKEFPRRETRKFFRAAPQRFSHLWGVVAAAAAAAARAGVYAVLSVAKCFLWRA